MPRKKKPAAASVLGRLARAMGFKVSDSEVESLFPKSDPPPAVHVHPSTWISPETKAALLEMLEEILRRQQPPPIAPRPPFPFPPMGTPPAVPTVGARPVTWRVILGIPADAKPSPADVHARWKKLCTVYHPDAGGSSESMNAITSARDAALRELENSVPATK